MPLNDASLISRMNKLGHHLRRFQHAYTSLTPGRRFEVLSYSVETLCGPGLRDALIEKHFGEKDPRVVLDDLEGLPERAIQSMMDMFASRTERMWPWVAYSLSGRPEEITAKGLYFDAQQKRSYEGDIAEFLGLHNEVAERYGLYPYPPLAERVKDQRALRFENRYLALNLRLIRGLQTYPTIAAGYAPLLLYIDHALHEYGKRTEDELRALIIEKAHPSSAKLQALTENRMWEGKETLASMCLTREVRQAVLDHYGVMRGLYTYGPISGYHVGQGLLLTQAQMKSVLRATAEDIE